MWGGDPGLAAHLLYARLNQISEQHDFGSFVEERCQRFYADEGRPGLPLGSHFHLLLIDYFEGLDAETRYRVASGGRVRPAGVSRLRATVQI